MEIPGIATFYGMANCLVAVWEVRRARDILFPSQTRRKKMDNAWRHGGNTRVRKRDWVQGKLDAAGLKLTFHDIAHDLSSVYYISVGVFTHDVRKLFNLYKKIFQNDPEIEAINAAQLAFEHKVAETYPDLDLFALKGLPNEGALPANPDPYSREEMEIIYRRIFYGFRALCPLLFPGIYDVTKIPEPRRRRVRLRRRRDFHIKEDGEDEDASEDEGYYFPPEAIIRLRRCRTPYIIITRNRKNKQMYLDSCNME